MSLLRGLLSLVAVTGLVLAAFAVPEAWSQQRSATSGRSAPAAPTGHQTEPADLNEGRSPAELFQGGCAVCHQSAGGLAKGRGQGELTNFLRQHYTSGAQHAAAMASFLASGAGGRGGPATAATPRISPNAPIERPPAPIGRGRPEDEAQGRKPAQEAARPPEREAPAKRKPSEKQAPVAARPAAQPAAPAAAAPAPDAAPAAAPETGTAVSAPPVEEKPAAPEIPL